MNYEIAQVTKVRRSRASCRGTASVEAAIVLPTLILLLFGVLFVSRSLSARHQAEDLARSCAWQYSANSCDEVPSGCGGMVKRVSNDVDLIGSVTSAGEQVTDDFSSIYDGKSMDFEKLASSIVTAALGDVITKSMIKDARGNVERDVSRQGISEDLDKVTAQYQIPCNLRPKTVSQIAKDAWSDVIDKLF